MLAPFQRVKDELLSHLITFALPAILEIPLRAYSNCHVLRLPEQKENTKAPESLRQLLTTLCADPRNLVFVISGREKEEMQVALGDVKVRLLLSLGLGFCVFDIFFRVVRGRGEE